MAVFRDEVCILKSKNFGESDKILTLFGKRRGKFNAIAKGIRKITSRKRGHLQTFSVSKISYALGKSLDLIVEAEEVFNIDSSKISSVEFNSLGFAAMVIDKFLPEDISDPNVYKAWRKYLKTNHEPEITGYFVINVLDYLGFLSTQQKNMWRESVSKSSDLSNLKKYVDKIINNL